VIKQDEGSQATVWDLYDNSLIGKIDESVILQEEMRANIDKEF